jgi:hypothetical protein
MNEEGEKSPPTPLDFKATGLIYISIQKLVHIFP